MENVIPDAIFMMLIAGAFAYTFKKSDSTNKRVDSKADKDEMCRVGEQLDHLTDRVDKIYDHLINGKSKKEAEE